MTSITPLRTLAAEAAAEAASDNTVRRGWLCGLGLHSWTRWELAGKYVTSDGHTYGWFQNRKCTRCGMQQESDV